MPRVQPDATGLLIVGPRQDGHHIPAVHPLREGRVPRADPLGSGLDAYWHHIHAPGWVHRSPRGGPNTGGYSFPSSDSEEVAGPHSGSVCGSPFSSVVDSSPLELESSSGLATATRRPVRWVSWEPEDVPRGDQRLAIANRSRRRASKSGHTLAQ